MGLNLDDDDKSLRISNHDDDDDDDDYDDDYDYETMMMMMMKAAYQQGSTKLLQCVSPCGAQTFTSNETQTFIIKQ